MESARLPSTGFDACAVRERGIPQETICTNIPVHLPVLEQDPLVKYVSANVFLKSVLGALLESFLPMSHRRYFAGVAALLTWEDTTAKNKKNKITKRENNI